MSTPILDQNFSARLFAAGCAMVPTYYGFAVKSAQQIGKAIPSINFDTTVRGGWRATPNVAFTVATQITVQEYFQKLFSPQTADPSLPVVLASSGIAGVICSPLLAGFNGQTMNMKFFESLKRTTIKESVAISFREAAFIVSLKINEPLLRMAQKKWGDKKWVVCGTAFLSGSLGSIVSHPADSLLSLLQVGEAIKISRLMRGVSSRTIATGFYVLIFDQVYTNNIKK